MSQSLPVINTAADNFQAFIDKTNAIINAVATVIITANNNANGATTTGNSYLTGTFGASVLVSNTMRGGNVQSSATLNITSNLAIGNSTVALLNVGPIISANATTLAVGDASLIDGVASFGNSTVNSTINSTAIAVGSNVALTNARLAVGNSTVNAVVNSSVISLNGVNTALITTRDSVAVGNTLVGTAGRINFINTATVTVAATYDASGGQINVQFTGAAAGVTPGGSNTQIQYNLSGALGASADFTFDPATGICYLNDTLLVTETILIGNSTVNATINSTMGKWGLGVVNTTTVAVGSNVVITAAGWSVGNSTVNSTANSTSLNTANLNFTGQVTGGNVAITTSRITVGNSTVNTFANATAVATGNVIVGTGVSIGSNVSLSTANLLIGNSTFSLFGNSLVLQIANTVQTAQVAPAGFTVGNSNLSGAFLSVGNTTVNAVVNSISMVIGGSVSNTSGHFIGNTVANTTALHANAIAAGVTLGAAGTIRAAGTIEFGASDWRAKKNFKAIQNALDGIMTIRTATYEMNELAIQHGYPDEGGKRRAGMFTQDWERVLPEAVSLAPFDDDGTGKSKSGLNFKNLDYEMTIAYLLEAVKELKSEVDRLKGA